MNKWKHPKRVFYHFRFASRNVNSIFLCIRVFFSFPLDDVVLVDEISHGINVKFEIWSGTLESKIFG